MAMTINLSPAQAQVYQEYRTSLDCELNLFCEWCLVAINSFTFRGTLYCVFLINNGPSKGEINRERSMGLRSFLPGLLEPCKSTLQTLGAVGMADRPLNDGRLRPELLARHQHRFTFNHHLYLSPG
jgi:hypothetical protein